MNIYNNDYLPILDLEKDYLQILKDDNFCFSMAEIQKMSTTRLEMADIPTVFNRVKRLIDALDNYLDIREDDVIRLDANMPDCLEIRFATRKDIKVNLYVENRNTPITGIPAPDYDEDEMFLSYKQNNRRYIRHGTMKQMVDVLKLILHET